MKISKTGSKLGMSKMCEKCVIGASVLPQRFGFKINRVVYSDSDGNLIKTTMNKLLKSNDHHITKYYRNTKYKSHFNHLDEDEEMDEDEDSA